MSRRKTRKYEVGMVLESHKSGLFEIIHLDWEARNVSVRWVVSKAETRHHITCLSRRPIKISDPLLPTVCGLGVYGIGSYTWYDNAYHIWSKMLDRCYNSASKAYSTYGAVGVTVCKEWHNYQNFAKWVSENSPDTVDSYEVDKDILCRGRGKLYSPDTCCIVPKELNLLLKLRSSRRESDLPIGVSLQASGRYLSRCSMYGKTKNLGTFDTAEIAFLAYKDAKEMYVKDVAFDYYNRGEIDVRVYEALCAYVAEPY